MTTTDDQRKIALSYLHAMHRDIKAHIIERPDAYKHDPAVGTAAYQAEQAIEKLLAYYETVE